MIAQLKIKHKIAAFANIIATTLDFGCHEFEFALRFQDIKSLANKRIVSFKLDIGIQIAW